MDKQVFIEEFKQADSKTDGAWIFNVINKSIVANLPDGNPRGHRNLIITMEELSELSQEVSKQLRVDGDYFKLLQELADVQLGLYYIQQICNISDDALHKAINVKMRRVENKLNEEGQYR